MKKKSTYMYLNYIVTHTHKLYSFFHCGRISSTYSNYMLTWIDKIKNSTVSNIKVFHTIHDKKH